MGQSVLPTIRLPLRLPPSRIARITPARTSDDIRNQGTTKVPSIDARQGLVGGDDRLARAVHKQHEGQGRRKQHRHAQRARSKRRTQDSQPARAAGIHCAASEPGPLDRRFTSVFGVHRPKGPPSWVSARHRGEPVYQCRRPCAGLGQFALTLFETFGDIRFRRTGLTPGARCPRRAGWQHCEPGQPHRTATGVSPGR